MGVCFFQISFCVDECPKIVRLGGFSFCVDQCVMRLCWWVQCVMRFFFLFSFCVDQSVYIKIVLVGFLFSFCVDRSVTRLCGWVGFLFLFCVD